METARSFAHIEPTAFTNNNVEWQRYRRLDLCHRCMDHVVDEINQICSEDKYFRFAEGKVRLGRCFWYLLSMDGLEIAATTMCTTDYCPVCEDPKDELDRTDHLYQLRGSVVRAQVAAAQSELLEPDGSVKQHCIGKVAHLHMIARYQTSYIFHARYRRKIIL